MKVITLIDWIDTAQGSPSIFRALADNGAPWASDIPRAYTELDDMYINFRSGSKIVSPYGIRSMRANGETLTPIDVNSITEGILRLYGDRWTRLYNLSKSTYDPLENYSMTENMSNDQRTVQHNGNRSETAHTENKSDSTGFADDNRTGFNSGSTPLLVSEGNTRGNASGSADGTQSGTDAYTDTETHSYRLTRSGNIGVTTSQQMAESEIKLWQWTFFNDVVFPDIDRVLTLSVY